MPFGGSGFLPVHDDEAKGAGRWLLIGIDAHKRTHTAVAVDDVGRELAHTPVKATAAGHLALRRWASRWSERRFAVEDCRHLARRLESDLLAAGEAVTRVPPQLMAAQRRGGRQLGKSAPIDGLALARAALREPDLPTAELDGPAREVRLLVDHRDALVRERTALHNRLRWHLHELDPELDVPPRGLRTRAGLDRVAAAIADVDGLVAELAGNLVNRCRQLNAKISDLERRLRPLVRQLAPNLLAVSGCGLLSAGKLIGKTGRASRCRSIDAYARFNGSAPVSVHSGNSEKTRLNRGGNRQVNTALHMIAVTQLRHGGPGADYVAKRQAAGDDKTEALRLLRRRVSDAVFKAMLADKRQRDHRDHSDPSGDHLAVAA